MVGPDLVIMKRVVRWRSFVEHVSRLRARSSFLRKGEILVNLKIIEGGRSL